MKPGDVLKEGVVVRHDDAGVWIGREANEGEPCPPRHAEFSFGGRRVFLSADQAPIPPAGLHARKEK